MSRKPQLFVPRDGYRLRRTKDAARLLPIFGGFLIFLPIMWAGGRTASGIIYLFVVWFLLIIVAAYLSRPLNDANSDEKQDLDKELDDGSI